MRTLIVKIDKCSKREAWYADFIGVEFKVEEGQTNFGYYTVAGSLTGKQIFKSDAVEVVPEQQYDPNAKFDNDDLLKIGKRLLNNIDKMSDDAALSGFIIEVRKFLVAKAVWKGEEEEHTEPQVALDGLLFKLYRQQKAAGYKSGVLNMIAVLGLEEEAGEFAGQLKKYMRKCNMETISREFVVESRDKAKSEMKDIFYYFFALTIVMNYPLEDIVRDLLVKVEGRGTFDITGGEPNKFWHLIAELPTNREHPVLDGDKDIDNDHLKHN